MSAAPTLENLQLQCLRVWAGNPRKTVDPVKLAELAESILEKGVCVPLIVRPLAAPEGRVTHEILAGQRRFIAANQAFSDDATVPCVVREVDDAEALELGLLENAARDDADPIEEAEAIEHLLTLGRSVEQVADRLGHATAWVEKRRKLVHLCDEARAWVRDRGVPLAHAQALATVPHDVQGEVAKRFAAGELPGSRFFLQELRAHLHALAKAPFDVTDAKLPGGACAKCTKRSDAQMDLFAAAANEGASCLDSACWRTKADAVWDAAQKSAKRRKLTVIADPKEVFSWGESPKYDGAYATASRMVEGVELKPVAIARSENGHVVELYDRKAVEEANKRIYESRRAAAAASEDEDEEHETGEGPRERAPKGPSKWEQERAARAERARAWLDRLAEALRAPGGAGALLAALTEPDNVQVFPELAPALEAVGLARDTRPGEIPYEQLLDVLLLALAAEEIDQRFSFSGASETAEAWVARACGGAPKAEPAEGPRRLTLKRAAWQKHRKGLLDAKGLALHNAWLPVGDDRELTIEPGADLDAVLAYAAEHDLALDVRAPGVPASDEADEGDDG